MKAYYSNSIREFIADNTDNIIGKLTRESGLAGFHQLLHKQTASWETEINLLKSAVATITDIHHSGIILEYPIARRSKRIDIIIVLNKIIIVIEFKDGKSTYDYVDEEQLIDYCLDLRDFHKESKDKKIFPIVFIPNGPNKNNSIVSSNEAVQNTLYANSNNLTGIITQIVRFDVQGNAIDYTLWELSDYQPTPTIIEAAQTLYSGKSVREITNSHAGKKNLGKTTDAVIEAVMYAKNNNKKVVCFITGVPGAGKTLAGLDIAHHPELQGNDGSLATFLSGNAPLIKVLREALTRDSYNRLKNSGTTTRKQEHERVIAFIENVHRFIDEYFFQKNKLPNNKVVVFDEAQRAWNSEQSKRKFNRDFSEPEMMFEIMNRHHDWAVIVALIGGGQEINTGEAGLREWGNNIVNKYPEWEVFVSPELMTGNHSTGNLTLFENLPDNIVLNKNPALHLDVSIRAYKAEELSNWVNLLLQNKYEDATGIFSSKLNEYDIVITRSFNRAKEWLKNKCKGNRRMGLVASSGARRLIAEGLDVKSELDAANWFLNPRDDVRSSYYLELPATEFSIQGLELDWVGVCWDLDLRRLNSDWDYKAFKGTKWQAVKSDEKRVYLLNKYRVLLTRAREGMVIWVPQGDINDYTRPPKEYDNIFDYLKSCGIPEI
jgi:hypothetical protein